MSIALILIALDKFYPSLDIDQQSVVSHNTTSNSTGQAGRPKKKRRVTFTTRS